MPLEKTFFSYSRDDSEFVLKLAKDLRAAGADVWLDQLDILAGKRWDAEVEKALEHAGTMMVILSPNSVASNNVMDEVSYALEEGKRVVPILLSDCEIPFRLKRLQRVDFTGDYEQALSKLLNALDLEKTKEPEKVPLNSENDDVNKLSDEKATIEEERKQESQTEESLWAKSRSDNTIVSYRNYLNETKLGKHKNEANRLITNIEKEAGLKHEDKIKIENEQIAKKQEEDRSTSQTNKYSEEGSSWLKKNYLKVVIPVVLVLISVIVIINISTEDSTSDLDAKDKNDWARANSTNIIWVIQDYLDKHPTGKYVSEAGQKISVLKENAGIMKSLDFVVCKKVSNLNPKNISNEFNKEIVYAWARVRAPITENLQFVWLDKDSSSLRSKTVDVSKDVNDGYRTYDRYTFRKEGRYEVRLYNSKNKIIGSQTFTIK